MGNKNYRVTFKYDYGTLEWLEKDKTVFQSHCRENEPAM